MGAQPAPPVALHAISTSQPMANLGDSLANVFRRCNFGTAQGQRTAEDAVADEQPFGRIAVIRAAGRQLCLDAMHVAIGGDGLRELPLLECDLAQAVVRVREVGLTWHIARVARRQQRGGREDGTIEFPCRLELPSRLEHSTSVGAG
jgi:hypothetical protein